MITVYSDSEGWLETTEDWAEGGWIHLEEPDEDEIELLHQRLGIPHNYLQAALDPREVARTNSRDDIHMVIVRVPYRFATGERVPYRTVPLAMIVTPDHFVTVCRLPIDFVRDLNYNYQDEQLQTRRGGRMILAVLGVVAEWSLRHLEEIDDKLEGLEQRLKTSIENDEMLELLGYEKSLVYLKTGLDWNGQMIDHLEEHDHFGWDKTDVDLLHDVEVEYRQGYHMAETMLTVLGVITEAYASLISNNLNAVMKFLTSVTIMLTVPTLIGSFYGMNVILWGEDNPNTVVLLVLLAVALVALTAWWFRRKGWLSAP